jgi:DNA repair exonuclease SbcCD ATPase subunit
MPIGFLMSVDQGLIERLKTADTAISQLAKTADKTKESVVKAFQDMGANGVDAFIRKLNEAKTAINGLGDAQLQGKGFANIASQMTASSTEVNKLIETISKLSQASKTTITINGIDATANQSKTAVDAINRLIQTLNQLEQQGGKDFLGGVNNLGKQTLRQMNSEARKMGKTFEKLEQAIQNYGMSATELANKIQQAREAQRQFNEEAKKQAKADAYNLMGGKGQATTLNELKSYASNLKSAMNNLDPKSAAWRQLNAILKTTNMEIKNIERSMKNVSNGSKGLMNSFDQLKRSIASVFSIQAISGYFNKLVTIRGEFEMQSRSLEVLLQNKDKANELWNQTVQLAIKSPFTVKQLVTYTKQLAAYRVESDKLYETNKMLADVSAGLGVDMNRLILAFGQVKAANFLRGTELRQFSEAGVNLLDELAKRFTALEGRAVSVGDVFERVSKRMVSFADVEAVLKTITSEGGLFYQMQEKQAETLRGQIMNLKDQIDLMFNAIGQDNEGFLKGLISTVKTLVENWESLTPLIKLSFGALVMYLSHKAVKGFATNIQVWRKQFALLAGSIGKGTKKMKEFYAASSMASKTNAWILLIETILTLGWVIYDAFIEASRFEKELGKVDADITKRLEESVDGYIQLTKTINDASKSLKEQEEALAKLQSSYKDILPDMMLHRDYISKIKGDYTEATQAMIVYYDKLAIKQKGDIIKRNAQESYETDETEFYENFLDSAQAALAGWTIDQNQFQKIRAGYSQIFQDVIRDAWSGAIDTSDMEAEFVSRLAKFADVSEKTIKKLADRDDGIKWRHQFGDIADEIDLATERLNGLSGVVSDTYESMERSQQEFKAEKTIDEVENAFDELKRITADVSIGEALDVKAVDNVFASLSTSAKVYLPQLRSAYQSMLDSAEKGNVEFKSSVVDVETTFRNSVAALLKYGRGKNFEGGFFNLGEKFEQEGEKFSETQKTIIQTIKDTAKEMQVDVDIFAKVVPNTKSTLGDIQKIIKGELETINESIKQYESSISAGLPAIFAKLIFLGGKSIEEMTKEAEAIETLAKKLGIAIGSTTSPTGSKKTDDTYLRRIKLVEDMRKAYEDLNKTWGETDALGKIQESFGDEAKELKVPIGKMDVSTIEGYIEALKSIESLVKKDAKAYKEWKKALREANLELERTAKIEGFEKTKRELDKLFDKYELSVEIDKLNMPKNIAEGLFGAESIDLSELRTRMNKETGDLLNDLAELRKMESKHNAEELKDNNAYQQLNAKINEKWSQEEIKLADETNKKLDELETKSIEDRLKKYTKYLNQSFSELGKVYVNGADQILEIEKTYDDALKKLAKDNGITIKVALTTQKGKELTEWRKNAIQGIQKETKKSIDEQQWDAFKSSAMYEQLFSDIEHLGTVATDMLIDRLKDLKDELKNLPPDVYKSIQQSIDKLEAHQIALNPFGVFKDSLKEVRKLEKTLYMDDKANIYRGRDAISAELGDTQDDIDKIVREIALLEAYEKSQNSINTMRKEGIDLTEREMMWLMSITDTTDEIAKREAQLNILRERAASLVVNLDIYAELSESQKEAIAMTKRWGDEIGKLLGGVDSLLDAFGVAEDSQARIWLQMSMGIVESITQMAMLTIQAEALGTATNAALGVIGWIATALQAVATLLSAVFQAHDQSIQRQIDDLAEGVKKLEKEFEALEKSIEKAFQIDSLKKDWSDAMTNINQRIADTAQMISLEQKKKSTDDDAIKDYEDQLAELEEQRKELYEETLESLGGVVDIRSATREFVDAWYDAFKETGNGLEGLKENFTDFFANVVAEQAVMTGAGKIMQPLFDEINKSLEGDFEVTAQEYANIDAKQAEQLKKLDTFLTEYYEKYGNILTSGDQLSGLQKGISGITEEQADILAAYWSSVRFFVANIDTTLTNLANHIFGQANAQDNPVVGQLKLIASNTTAINNLLENVTKGGHPKGGQGIKVFIN